MKKMWKNVLSLLLALSLTVSITGCGSQEAAPGTENTQTEGAESAEASASDGEKIINIGVTDSLGGVNPFVIDQTEINKYAVGLMFLPLMELDSELNFVGMLADSITTEDNLNFTVHINDEAVWSDGTPVTAADVEFTVRRLASPVVNNTTLMLYAFEGIGDDGFVTAGAESIDGIQIIDDKTVRFTSKNPMALTTFENTYARYIHTLPKHIIEKFSEEELLTTEWFNKPDVINGPFYLTDYDNNHYISYEANRDYWKGAPKIDKLNIKIVDASQVLAGLQSGEIDITHHTLTAIPQKDYQSLEALENVDVVYGAPITNQSAFIQTANIKDARVRQALVYAIDRQKLVDELLQGHGEVVDGFLSSASPFFDESLSVIPYDPEKAKALLQEAGWDGSQTLRFYVNAGDTTFVNGAQVLVAQWAEVGIKVEVQTVDLATLMTIAGSTDYDIMAVQYTYAPVDPYPDIDWLLNGEGSWTGYLSDEIKTALADAQKTSDVDEITKLYSIVDKKVQEDVPMFSVYIISAQGAVSKRIKGAQPSAYGFFNDVQNWDISENA
ncbi:ABC transporter substrate-binding protein [bacterium C-53]|nr:ABC transporter substrate-binding protein [Lachnospiraceae bacterium]NBI01714.1 ABC transporter substrate-binding protein [Lachnospiraceae bacterium]RKJ13000.1 ABC transporter substrate-binding protein [bacterium C-53]